MAPETRSATRRVTRSSAASTSVKKRGETESVAVAKVPPKRGRKKPVKVAGKRKIPKGKRTGTVDEGEGREGRLCAECGELGWYGDVCDNCDGEALCTVSIMESVPSECYSSN
jgi:hypothetical protein